MKKHDSTAVFEKAALSTQTDRLSKEDTLATEERRR